MSEDSTPRTSRASDIRTGASGVVLMFLASGCLCIMAAAVKALGPGFPYAEAVMFRALLGLPLLLGLGWRQYQRGQSLRPRRADLLLLRGVLGLCTMIGNFYALQRGVLANIVVINRFQPVVVAIAAPLLIRETMPRLTIAALCLSLLGVLMVAQPSAAGVDTASAVALAATFTSAMAHLSVRRLSATDAPLTIVICFTAITTVGATTMALPVWSTPTVHQWGLLLAAALSATCGQLSMTVAYGRQPAPVVAAASYSSVVFALIIGYLFWKEVPNSLALGGAAVVTAAGVLLTLGSSTGSAAN